MNWTDGVFEAINFVIIIGFLWHINKKIHAICEHLGISKRGGAE